MKYSNFTDDEELDIEQEPRKTKAQDKKQISEAQRKARIENLRLGRIKRSMNIEARKQEALKPVPEKPKRMKYKIQHEETESDTESESDDEEELVLQRKSKSKNCKKVTLS